MADPSTRRLLQSRGFGLGTSFPRAHESHAENGDDEQCCPDALRWNRDGDGCLRGGWCRYGDVDRRLPELRYRAAQLTAVQLIGHVGEREIHQALLWAGLGVYFGVHLRWIRTPVQTVRRAEESRNAKASVSVGLIYSATRTAAANTAESRGSLCCAGLSAPRPAGFGSVR